MIEAIATKARERARDGRKINRLVLGPVAFAQLTRELYAKVHTVQRADMPTLQRVGFKPLPDVPKPDTCMQIDLVISNQHVRVYCDEYQDDMRVHWDNEEPVTVAEAAAVVAASEPVAEPAPVAPALAEADTEPEIAWTTAPAVEAKPARTRKAKP